MVSPAADWHGHFQRQTRPTGRNRLTRRPGCLPRFQPSTCRWRYSPGLIRGHPAQRCRLGDDEGRSIKSEDRRRQTLSDNEVEAALCRGAAQLMKRTNSRGQRQQQDCRPVSRSITGFAKNARYGAPKQRLPSGFPDGQRKGFEESWIPF